MGRLSVLLGAGCLLILCYWIVALHYPLPGKQFFADLYGEPRGRRGPPVIYILGLGGLFLIWSGLRKLGIADDDESHP